MQLPLVVGDTCNKIVLPLAQKRIPVQYERTGTVKHQAKEAQIITGKGTVQYSCTGIMQKHKQSCCVSFAYELVLGILLRLEM